MHVLKKKHFSEKSKRKQSLKYFFPNRVGFQEQLLRSFLNFSFIPVTMLFKVRSGSSNWFLEFEPPLKACLAFIF